MMLNLNESFAGLRILSLVSKQSIHREVYEALTPKSQKVYLIVYDNHNRRMLMDKGKMREFAMLSRLTNAAFPIPIKTDEALLKKVLSATRPSVTTEELRQYRKIWDEFTNKSTTQRQTIGYRAYN